MQSGAAEIAQWVRVLAIKARGHELESQHQCLKKNREAWLDMPVNPAPWGGDQWRKEIEEALLSEDNKAKSDIFTHGAGLPPILLMCFTKHIPYITPGIYTHVHTAGNKLYNRKYAFPLQKKKTPNFISQYETLIKIHY